MGRKAAWALLVYGGKLLAAFRQGLEHDQLTWPEGGSRQQMEHLLNQLGRTKAAAGARLGRRVHPRAWQVSRANGPPDTYDASR